MISIFRYLYQLIDKFFPRLGFKKKYFEKELEPTDEDLDKWATEYLERQERERRTKRGKYKDGLY